MTDQQALTAQPKMMPADVRAILAARLQPSAARNLVTKMLATYPPGARDTREYLDGLARELCTHPEMIARRCAGEDGLVVECMFKPTIADIHRFCEREAKWLRDMHEAFERKIDERNRLGLMKSDAQIDEERKTRPTFDELIAKYGPNFGIKTTADVDRTEAVERQQRRDREMHDRMALAEFQHLGIDPVFDADGRPVSPSLLRSVGKLTSART